MVINMESFIAFAIVEKPQPHAQSLELAGVKLINKQVSQKYQQCLDNVSPAKRLEAIDTIKASLTLHPDFWLKEDILLWHQSSLISLSFADDLKTALTDIGFVDISELAKIALPALASSDLNSLAAFLNLPSPGQQVLARAETIGFIFVRLVEILNSLPTPALIQIVKILNTPSSLLGKILAKILLQKIKTGGLEKLKTDQLFLGNKPQIHKNDSGTNREISFDVAKIIELMGKDGQFAAQYPEFEFRQSQIIMLEKICDALVSANFLIIEAATGTGKTLAY